MQKIIEVFIIAFFFTTLSGCGIYSFSGAKIDAKSVQIDYFQNNAQLVEPTLSPAFTNALQDKFLKQTRLNLVKNGGDLQFEGEITGYNIDATSATSDQSAAQSRLTITINVRYYNTLNDQDDFEKSFSHFFDYPANSQLVGSVLEDAYLVIFERITQDIFSESVAKW